MTDDPADLVPASHPSAMSDDRAAGESNGGGLIDAVANGTADLATEAIAEAGCSGCSCSLVVLLGAALTAGSAFAVQLIR